MPQHTDRIRYRIRLTSDRQNPFGSFIHRLAVTPPQTVHEYTGLVYLSALFVPLPVSSASSELSTYYP